MKPASNSPPLDATIVRATGPETTMSNFVISTARGLVAFLAIFWIVQAPVLAQGQPSSVNPTASSVNEQKLLEALKPGTTPGSAQSVGGRVSIPDKDSARLIQPAGLEFRAFHQGTLPKVGAYAILGMIVLVAVFFLVRGRVRLSEGFSGRTVLRFGSIERFTHWLTAVSFILLGLSGLNLTFGKTLVLPYVAPETFTWATQLGKLVHNYVSFAFALGLVLMFVLWIKDNFPHPRDIGWLARGGGLIGNSHPPAGRFNFGQKLIFWSVIFGGGGLSVSGYVLMFPFQVTDIAGMQLAGIVHGVLGVVLVAIIVAHVYIGSLGMEGAFSAMGTGKVDVNWAKEHHSVWAEKVVARETEATRQPRPAPAE
jgi:formate dehydrogenase subunit gamma